MASPIYLQKKARRSPTFREVVLMHAVARGHVSRTYRQHQGSWVKLGFDSISQLLQSGANDLGGTLMDENISGPLARPRHRGQRRGLPPHR